MYGIHLIEGDDQGPNLSRIGRDGSKKCKMMMKGHYKQRSNRSDDGGFYGNSIKAQFIAEVSSLRAQLL